MTSRQRPTVAFWLVVAVIGLPIVYVASFGPACWLNERRWFGGEALSTVYRPVIALAAHNRLRGPILWYAALGISSDDVPLIDKGRIKWRTPYVDSDVFAL